jgi:hypothetical protein
MGFLQPGDAPGCLFEEVPYKMKMAEVEVRSVCHQTDTQIGSQQYCQAERKFRTNLNN